MTIQPQDTALQLLQACADAAFEQGVTARTRASAQYDERSFSAAALAHSTRPVPPVEAKARARQLVPAHRPLMGMAEGTLINTQAGPLPIEHLRLGDMIATFDSEIQPIRWILKTTLLGEETGAAVRFSADSYGYGDLLTGPSTMVLVEGDRPTTIVGHDEVLVSARNMIDNTAIHSALGARSMTFYHLLFDKHELVTANGRLVASLYPDSQTLDALSTADRNDLFDAAPDLRTDADSYGVPARMRLSKIQADRLRELA